MEGELPWDIFFSNTRQEVVMQFDTGNALVGGAEPLNFLKRYPGRAITVHLKEHSATNDKALIGGRRAVGRGVRHLREHRRHRVVHRRAGKLRLPADGVR